jgi:hypothetical protein
MAFMTFHILGIFIPTDELIFFRGVETTNQYMMNPNFTGFNRNILGYHGKVRFNGDAM